jgi:hypothetical protein
MGSHEAPNRDGVVPNRLREAFARLWTLLWRGCDSPAANTEHDGESRQRAEARARFWNEFRQGEREADAHRSRQR